MLKLVAGLVLAGTVLTAQAGCPSRSAFHDELLSITSLGSDSASVVLKKQQLTLWLTRWQQCHDQQDSSYVVALNQLAYLHGTSNDPSSAILYAKQAVAVYDKPGVRLKISDLALSCYRLGAFLDYAGETEKAIDPLLKATDIARRYQQAQISGVAAYPYIIYYYYTKGDFGKALLYAEQGEKMAYSLGNDVSTSKLLHQKSQVLAELERYKEAKDALESAIALIRPYANSQKSHADQERLMGRILREIGKPEEGLKHYLLAYSLARKSNHENLSDFANSLGQHYYATGNFKKALDYYQEALRIDKSQFSKSLILDNIGLAYSQLKKYNEALKFHQLGLTELSIAYTDTHRTSLPPARAIRSEPQKEYFLFMVQDKADTWLQYAQYSQNDPTKLRHALRTYMLADSMIDYMRREHSQEGSKLFWRQKTRSMYEKAIQTCYLLNDPAAALYFFEKSRAVLLSDKLNELNAGLRLKPEDQEKEEQLRKRVTNLQNQLNHTSSTDPDLPALRTRLLETQKEQDLFFKALESTNPQYFSYKYDNHVPDLHSLRQKLLASPGKKSGFLTYFVGDSAMYGIYVCSDRVSFKMLNRADYLRHKSGFTALLVDQEQQNRHMDQYLRAAHGLYQNLLVPFTIPKNTKLIISPDGDFIPFAALSLSPQKPDYLIHYHALSYTYSARLLEMVPKSAETHLWNEKTFLGIAPVEFSKTSRLAALPGSDLALEAIEQHFLFSKSLTLQAATRRAFVEQAPDYRIVQLFTHADADSVRTPRLYFADSVLSLPELTAVRGFRTRLMVLSACKTGIGKNQRGEGVFSLARGFASLGIPTTLTTLWSVENKAMYGLNQLFYEYIDDELPLDEALQKAQIQWLTTKSRSEQLPYVWAGVVLVGHTDPIPSDSYEIFVAGILIVLLIAGVTGFLIYFFKKRK